MPARRSRQATVRWNARDAELEIRAFNDADDLGPELAEEMRAQEEQLHTQEERLRTGR